jgi:hypothetical protein
MAVARWRCRPWSHQYFLRLDDYEVECVHCHRVKREPRRVHRAGHNAKEKQVTLSPYWKAAIALVGAVATAVVQVFGPEGTAGQVATIVVALATALGVYQVQNKPAVQ